MKNHVKIHNSDHYVHPLISNNLTDNCSNEESEVSQEKFASQIEQKPTKNCEQNLAQDQQTLDGDQAFARVSAKLKVQIGADAYASWFGRLKLVEYSRSQVRLSVPTAFLRSWINNHYFSLLSALWREENPEILRVEILVRGVNRASSGQTASSHSPLAPSSATTSYPLTNITKNKNRKLTMTGQTAAPSSASSFLDHEQNNSNHFDTAFNSSSSSMHMLFGSPLDGRYNFDNFVEGSSNRVALAAARSIAEAGTGALRFNPLFIHAGVGLGKTHLLQAIASASLKRPHPARVVYLTAEYFMWRFASAIRDNDTLSFKEQLRTIDLLIIDDMQFLQGKSIQNEFCHLLNNLLDSARQIVVAADRPPAELESLDVRVRSRLSCGVSLEMGLPDYQMRFEILRRRLEAAKKEDPSCSITQDMIKHIASSVTGSGRELEGAFNQILFRQSFETELSNARINEILTHLTGQGEVKRVRIEDIQRLVARHYNVSKQDMLSNRRTRAIVRPRQVAMYLAKTLTPRSLPEIGRSFGGRDHTTVLHAVRTVEGRLNEDSKLAQEMELLKRLIHERPN